ncbi:MAG: hypothetical protein VW475_05825, partial [Curvibacter sp.]
AMNNDVQFAEWITGHAMEGVSRIVSRYQGEAEITKKAKIVEAIRFDLLHPEPTWETGLPEVPYGLVAST